MTELEKPKMDDEYIIQSDIVRRYLQNKLTPEETVEFEEYILDKPELLEQLELDMVLVETLPRNEKKTIQTAIRKSSWWRPMYSHSIAVVTFSALVIILFYGKDPVPLDPSFSPTIVYLDNYRGANETSKLTFKKGETFKILTIDVPPNLDDYFDLEITDANQNKIVQKKVSKNAENEVNTFLYREMLTTHSHSLKLSKDGNILLVFKLEVIDEL